MDEGGQWRHYVDERFDIYREPWKLLRAFAYCAAFRRTGSEFRQSDASAMTKLPVPMREVGWRVT